MHHKRPRDGGSHGSLYRVQWMITVGSLLAQRGFCWMAKCGLETEVCGFFPLRDVRDVCVYGRWYSMLIGRMNEWAVKPRGKSGFETGGRVAQLVSEEGLFGWMAAGGSG